MGFAGKMDSDKIESNKKFKQNFEESVICVVVNFGNEIRFY